MSNGPTTVVAVDFGASSIRVCRVALGKGPPQMEVVHRYTHGAVLDPQGHQRWEWSRLVAEMERGLLAALDRGPVASIGIDTWGVDYGLLDEQGRLLSPPFSYRDHRTDGYRQVVEHLGEEALYATTGIQLQPFNTLFQVAAHDRDELARARHLLLLPELLVHHLTGAVTAERTSAGTTALVDLATGDWSTDLAGAVGLRPDLLPPIAPAGQLVGRWRGVPVHLVGGHDTASAVVAMGAPQRRGSARGTAAELGRIDDRATARRPGSAFVSAGTWLLVGREQPEPDTGEPARRANFTNEAGALGGIRFLKNLAGSWLIEGCRPAWGDPPVVDLLAEAANVDAADPLLREATPLDVTDPRFLHPDDMLYEVTAAAGLPTDTPPAIVARHVVTSSTACTAGVLDQLGGVTDVYVFGGGSRDPLYRHLLAAASGRPVHRGPVEATALGNALVQGIALGRYTDLADARAHLEDDEPHDR
jgi:rhamnulokinase